MAIINLQPPFDQISGTLEKRGIVHRKKHYRDDNGKVLFIGKQEAYSVKHPRDYGTNPPQGAELQNITVFKQANDLTAAILHSADYTGQDLELMTQEESTRILSLQSRLADYKRRFIAQSKRPDPQAPVNPRTHRRKQYVTLNTFIRAMLIQEIKQQP